MYADICSRYGLYMATHQTHPRTLKKEGFNQKKNVSVLRFPKTDVTLKNEIRH